MGKGSTVETELLHAAVQGQGVGETNQPTCPKHKATPSHIRQRKMFCSQHLHRFKKYLSKQMLEKRWEIIQV